MPLDISLEPNVRYINLGDWISHYTYGVFDGEQLKLNTWKPA